MNFTKFLRKPFLQDTSGWLLLIFRKLDIQTLKSKKLVHSVNIVGTLYLMSRNVDFFMIHKTWKTYQYRGTFYYWCFRDFDFTGHAGKVRPETWDQGLLGGTRDLEPHKWDPGPQLFKWDPGFGTSEVGR